MGFLIWLLVGGIVGWLTTLLMRTEQKEGELLLNVVIGVVGAFSGASILAPLTGAADMSIASTVCALIGAIILLAIVNLLGRSPKRSGHDQT